jgi:predicted metal-dependent enzyme (double-stranded beta helix superfamily)
MKPHDLVTRFAQARESTDPLAAMREVLESLRGRVDEIEQALDYIPGTGGNANQVFYRSPDLTLLKVRFPNGRRTPPHDHGTWASILLLSGGEKNTLYRTDGGALRRASEVTLARGSVLTMRAETAHVAECVGDTPAVGLHVYGGDIFRLPRRMWHPQTLEAHPLDWALYENFARIASAAAGAPVP